MQEVNVNVTNSNGEPIKVIIEERTGDALPLKEPRKIAIIGSSETALRWVQANYANFDNDKAVIIVNRDKMTITIAEDLNSIYGTEIQSKLVVSSEIIKLGINTDAAYDNHGLSRLLRMNRGLLSDKAGSLKLVSDLKNLKIKAEKLVESANDNRGSISEKREIAIKECNIPTVIQFEIPVFKGSKKQLIEVELDINPMNYDISLVSPQLNEIIETTKNEIMDSEIADLKSFTIVILEEI